MDLSLLIVLLVLLAIALFVLPPLLRGDAQSVPAGSDPAVDSLASAMSRRDSSYEELADLEFEYASGKVSADQFATLKAQYQQAAVKALKDLEGLEEKGRTSEPTPGDGAGTP